VRRARDIEGGANSGELRGTQFRLDAHKQGPLLVAYVIPQLLAESVEGRRVHERSGLEVVDPPTNVYVLDEHANYVRIVGAGVTREGRQKQLLLEAEVRPALLAPEFERGLSEVLGVGVGRALQAKG